MQPISSYTEQFIADLKATRSEILRVAKMDEMAYAELIYDTGCAFINDFSMQYVTCRETIRENLRDNKGWGFWDWWKTKWALDDIAIMQHDDQLDMVLISVAITPAEQYRIIKEAMIDDGMLQKECYYLINDKI